MSDVPRYLGQYSGLYAAGGVDGAAIVADVAGRLGITVEQAEPYVSAAIDYIVDDTGCPALELPADDQRLVKSGIPLLAMRMYQDTPNLGGENNQLDPTFTGVYTPARLYSHLGEYWRHLSRQWGMA